MGVVALVVAHWGLTTKHALDRGIFNFDSLWYHMPFAADMAQSHSVTGLHHTETVFTNWFYPQNSELLHAVGILLTGRDTLSLFLNFGWLAIAFLAAWCIGRPYGRGHSASSPPRSCSSATRWSCASPGRPRTTSPPPRCCSPRSRSWSTPGQPRREGGGARSAGGLAAGGGGSRRSGWPSGTKSTALAMAAALTRGGGGAGAGRPALGGAAWWFVPALARRRLLVPAQPVVAGNPMPEVEQLGPISLPHPERLQEGRPDFNIVHYATDTGVWRDYFAPGLHQAFGVALAAGRLRRRSPAALLASAAGRDRIVRWVGAVALFGLLAYLFTPLSAAGAEGAPVGFGINIRYAIPALLAGAGPRCRCPALPRRPPRRQWRLLGALRPRPRPHRPLRRRAPRPRARSSRSLLAVLAGRCPGRPAAAQARRPSAAGASLRRASRPSPSPSSRSATRSSATTCGDRFANDGPPRNGSPACTSTPPTAGPATSSDARIGLAGTTAGFLGYGFYGTDLSNRRPLPRRRGPARRLQRDPHLRRASAPPSTPPTSTTWSPPPSSTSSTPSDPIPSPEARWLRGEQAVEPIVRSGPVTVWRVEGELDPAACGPAQRAPARIPEHARLLNAWPRAAVGYLAR